MLRGGAATVEAFAAAYDRSASRAMDPGLITKLIARLRRHALDSALMAGVDPAESPQLAARAGSLTSACTRARMAETLERLAATARQPGSRRRIAPHRESVIAQSEHLRSLGVLLRGTRPVYAHGMAMLEELLTDGTGPAYEGDPTAFAHRLDEVEGALRG